jgi:hypothetical protein
LFNGRSESKYCKIKLLSTVQIIWWLFSQFWRQSKRVEISLERKERELRREREEGRKAAGRLTLLFSTNKYVFVSNKFEIHLLMQGMTGFFDCTGHLLLFGLIVIVFIFMVRSPLSRQPAFLLRFGWCLILQKPVISALFHLV